MKKSLKKMLSMAFVLGWAGTAMAADAPASGEGSGSGSGSLPPTPPPGQVAAAPGGYCGNGGCCNNGGWINQEGCDNGLDGTGIIIGGEWHILRPVING